MVPLTEIGWMELNKLLCPKLGASISWFPGFRGIHAEPVKEPVSGEMWKVLFVNILLVDFSSNKTWDFIFFTVSYC